jgi:hypothetical protein
LMARNDSLDADFPDPPEDDPLEEPEPLHAASANVALSPTAPSSSIRRRFSIEFTVPP